MDSLLHEKLETTLETLELARRRIMELEAELEILRGLESAGGLAVPQQQPSHAIQTDQDFEVIEGHFIDYIHRICVRGVVVFTNQQSVFVLFSEEKVSAGPCEIVPCQS